MVGEACGWAGAAERPSGAAGGATFGSGNGCPLCGRRKGAEQCCDCSAGPRPRFDASAGEHQRLLDAFLKAAYAGELDELKSPLTESVEMYSDGGGKVEAARDVVRGVAAVAHFLVLVLHDRAQAHVDRRLELRRFNGAPGVLVHEAGRLVTALGISVHEGRISHIYAVRNPDKLVRLARS